MVILGNVMEFEWIYELVVFDEICVEKLFGEKDMFGIEVDFKIEEDKMEINLLVILKLVCKFIRSRF